MLDKKMLDLVLLSTRVNETYEEADEKLVQLLQEDRDLGGR